MGAMATYVRDRAAIAKHRTGSAAGTRTAPRQDHNGARGTPSPARGSGSRIRNRACLSSDDWPHKESPRHCGPCAATESKAPTRRSTHWRASLTPS